ncbi:hypothetical protein TKK_0009431 [Trichogramma kaykai]
MFNEINNIVFKYAYGTKKPKLEEEQSASYSRETTPQMSYFLQPSSYRPFWQPLPYNGPAFKRELVSPKKKRIPKNIDYHEEQSSHSSDPPNANSQENLMRGIVHLKLQLQQQQQRQQQIFSQFPVNQGYILPQQIQGPFLQQPRVIPAVIPAAVPSTSTFPDQLGQRPQQHQEPPQKKAKQQRKNRPKQVSKANDDKDDELSSSDGEEKKEEQANVERDHLEKKKTKEIKQKDNKDDQ